MLAAIASVLTGLSAAAPEGPAMTTVVKAKSQLRGGLLLSASDLVLDQVVASDVPEGVLTDVDELVGKTLAAPVAQNQMMTLLTTTAARTSVPSGHVIAPLRLGDLALTALLRPAMSSTLSPPILKGASQPPSLRPTCEWLPCRRRRTIGRARTQMVAWCSSR